jgi:NAD(P)H-hydrate epimerase
VTARGGPPDDTSFERRPEWRSFTPPDGIEKLAEEWVAGLVPERPPRGHKGTFGTLLCVCGSLDYLGAALLVGHAALRSGAGLVTLAMPRSVQTHAAGRVVEATTLGLPEVAPGDVDADAAAELVASRDVSALVVGSGMRAGEPTRNLVRRLIAADGPVAVLDAEALNSLAATDGWHETVRRPLVLTPHPGEFRRLEDAEIGDDNAERAERARAASERWGVTVVLKGANTVIAAPDGRLRMAPFQNPALGTGGTGDVLAGVLGSLLSQHAEPFEAACLAVWLHGIAGEHVRERIGEAGLLAGELPWEVPRIRRHLSELGRHAAQGTPRVGFARRNS